MGDQEPTKKTAAATADAVANSTQTAPPKDFAGALQAVIDSLLEMWASFLAHLPLLVAGLGVLLVTWIVARISVRVVGRLAHRANTRASLRDLIRQMASVTVWVIGLTIAATVVFPDMTPTRILTVLGLSSIAIGFAFKDIVENFFAGVLILWRFPLEPGDFVTVEGISGKVEETTIRNTLIRQVDGQLIVAPNAMLFKNPVYVMTNLDRRRTTIMCGVGYGEDVANSREVIQKAVRGCDTVDTSQDVEIFAQAFGSSSIDFEVTWWTRPTPLAVRQSRDQVIEAVKQALDNAGIEIPFPYRTLTFGEPVPINQVDIQQRT